MLSHANKKYDVPTVFTKRLLRFILTRVIVSNASTRVGYKPRFVFSATGATIRDLDIAFHVLASTHNDSCRTATTWPLEARVTHATFDNFRRPEGLPFYPLDDASDRVDSA
jgi:hypothetical protein